jgi:hypothetical protein
MGSRQRFIEDDNPYQITSSTAIALARYDEDTQDILFKCFSIVDYPGENKYDYWAINIDDDLILEVSVLGRKNNNVTIYKVSTIKDVDVYLDYINAQKAIKWNTHLMTLTK